MPSILNLKFKGNKSFVAFSNLNDTEALSKTWKVASFLEQGQRLENLSWRLWHLQNLMVDTDNAKSKREFKKLSKCMGDKLDKEKGRSIEELEAPDFKRTTSSDIIRQRAVEKERYREQNAKPGTIKRMQFTFSVDQPSAPGANLPVKKPDLKPSPEFTKRTRAAVRAQTDDSTTATFSAHAATTSAHISQSDNMVVVDDSAHDQDSFSPSLPVPSSTSQTRSSQFSQSLKFDSIFNQGFGPSALLFPAPTLTTSMNYGEGLNPSNARNDTFTISRPTIELPLDEILNNVDSPIASILEHHEPDILQYPPQPQQLSQPRPQSQPQSQLPPQPQPQPQQDIIMRSIPSTTSLSNNGRRRTRKSSVATRDDGDSDDEASDGAPSTSTNLMLKSITPLSQAVKESALPETVAPSKLNPLFTTTAVTRTNLSTRPTLTVKTQTSTSRSSGPGATATSLNPTSLRTGNSAPGGVKAECSNCGATHTPLWRRGLNDELNCNACGLYCKLHKRPRPKSMRNSHGEGRTQATPRQDPVDVMAQTAQCYNCHTTATPLWRKDDEGKTVCNACGLYYKLHGSARPISMKSDVIRKRSRHDARRGSNAGVIGVEDTPSASPGVSRRASPARDPSPTLAPDSTTALSYDYSHDHLTDAFATQSELVGALGQDQSTTALFQNTFQFQFPGPYHPDYLLQMYTAHAQAAVAVSAAANPDGLTAFGSPSVGVVDISPAAGNNVNANGGSNGSDMDLSLMSPRSPKRRRMSTDSASEPPSSAVSFSSFGDGYSPASSTTSLSSRSSMEFPFTSYATASGTTTNGGTGGNNNSAGPALRGSGNTFWHPPMMPQSDEVHTSSPHLGFHPPMLPPLSSSSGGVSSASSGVSGVGKNHMSGSLGGRTDGCSPDVQDHHEDSPMDYLHPPMNLSGVGPDDDSLFSAYLHPPMTMQEDSPSIAA
ncbi:hypothetical protein P691DRAFT_790635 [Macrolepiota fuliginosa MF-IS2]|uniref:GATA-type domain-containing protein n=1 Tax=Macrolepiota fuliginosa MF-IS2 TaxID=1400762 RepID=A0A9P5XE38_9AGAR|nr:hypothetical protein P691DRAFT_790635 [Macrolepiota fuliginosa MF-IS2]